MVLEILLYAMLECFIKISLATKYHSSSQIKSLMLSYLSVSLLCVYGCFNCHNIRLVLISAILAVSHPAVVRYDSTGYSVIITDKSDGQNTLNKVVVN